MKDEIPLPPSTLSGTLKKEYFYWPQRDSQMCWRWRRESESDPVTDMVLRDLDPKDSTEISEHSDHVCPSKV